jgi:uncharacterized BrkB/YihY/UPF0761 family membrane protein
MTIWSSSSGINAVRKGLYKAYRKLETDHLAGYNG